MGAVYKALHTRLEKLVAIKVLPQERMQDRDAQSRFQREIKALGRLNHPNLVQAHDAWEVQGTTILVMEYVDGLDASALAKKLGPLPIADACEIVRQAALGLQYAHQHDLVHRDIKPSNLMLNRDGQIKVLDLGLARIRQGQANQQDMTSAGQMMGTADYIAPEQVRDSHSVDIRADIYSLGCTLYQLLAGRTLFSGEKYASAFDKMMAHVKESPPSVLESRPDVPRPLVAVIERMLAKRPDERFAVPREVAAALTPFTSGCNLAALVSATDSTPSTTVPVDTSMAVTDEYLSRPSTGTHASQAALIGANKPPALPSFNPSPSGAGVAVSSSPLVAESPNVARNRLPSSAAKRTERRPAVLIALGLLGILVLAGVIFKLRTREGTLVVEVNQPDAEVQVLDDQGEIVVDLKSGEKPVAIGVDPGKHRIRVQKDGFELFTDEFTMKVGGREAIRATLQPLAPAKVLTPPSSTAGDLASGGQHPGEKQPRGQPPGGPDFQSGRDGLKKRPTNELSRLASGDASKNYELEFDGVRSYVETPVKYDGLHPITIEAWVTAGSRPADGVDVLGNTVGIDRRGFVLSYLREGTWASVHHFDGIWKRSIVGTTPASPLVPTHVCITTDEDGTVKLFVEGRQEGTTTKDMQSLGSRLPFAVGGNFAAPQK
jgi:serine/threonine protein kinase